MIEEGGEGGYCIAAGNAVDAMNCVPLSFRIPDPASHRSALNPQRSIHHFSRFPHFILHFSFYILHSLRSLIGEPAGGEDESEVLVVCHCVQIAPGVAVE